ncbi:MAG TPA: IPT/TIG domain-containing protein [Blastocatellia bacterium]|nr:IPT/TIG domain-containing protein [Blastocatellia bacterium]
MKSLWRIKLAISIGCLSSVFVSANCHVMGTQAESTMTESEIESMARRVAPALGITGPDPELPRVFIDTTYTAPTGRTIAVPEGGDFQAAIDQAQPGDVITLQAGATYTGNFTLPAKSGSDWIVIRTSAPDTSLPSSGGRITPGYRNVLPKIVSPNSGPALEALSGSHHFRLIGLEFAMATNVSMTVSLILLGDKQTSLSQLPHDLILDRLYIHGSPTTTLRRGITLNSASTAVIDSYIADCHDENADSQAIGGWNGAGPFKIVNNYLEGAGENFILGGADPTIPNLAPSDIEFRRNYCFKPLSWRIGDPSYAGRPWGVKNLFELKNAQRVLIEGNIFEHCWTMAQTGYAILFTVRNQDGTAPWSVVQDVTFTNNIIRRVGGGFNMHGTDNNFPSMVTRRIRIANNLLEDIDQDRFSGTGIAFQIGGEDGPLSKGGILDLSIDNNTIFHTNFITATGGSPSQGLVFTNNLLPHNQFGVRGDGTGTGNETINTYFHGSVFKKNVFVGGPAELYPPDNFFPTSFDQVGFVNRAGGNFRLNPDSPFKDAGTDGKDIGCDFGALDRALSPPLTISRVTPAKIPRFSTTTVTITGTGFNPGSKVRFSRAGIAILKYVSIEEDKIIITLKTDKKTPLGNRDVIVTNPNGANARLAQACFVSHS